MRPTIAILWRNPVRPVGPQAIPSRSGEAMRRLADLTGPLKPDGESRCLSVGRGITLSGEVNSCDKLLIEGSVDAKLTNCRAIEIAESGLFKGSTSIDEAEIRGRFEGDLTVRNRLLIKATGRVSGTIRYGQIEIECGGQIFGDIQAQPAGELGRLPCRAGSQLSHRMIEMIDPIFINMDYAGARRGRPPRIAAGRGAAS
jgi:cytoskeletal protein CcmA (bactofilin family)